VVTVTFVSLNLNPVTTGRTDLSDTTGTIPETVGIEISPVRAATVTVAPAVATVTFVSMENLAAIVTRKITVFVARSANIATIVSTVRIVLIHMTATIVTFDRVVVSATFAPLHITGTSPPSGTNGNFRTIVVMSKLLTTGTIGTIPIDAILAPKLIIRTHGTLVTIDLFLTTGTDELFVIIGTSDTTATKCIIHTEHTPLNGGVHNPLLPLLGW